MNRNNPSKVSILIPNKDHRELLEPCIKSILELTTYNNYEIVVIENNSSKKEIFAYYDELKSAQKVRVIEYPDLEFNYQKIMNFAVKNCEADYILQLNNDTLLLTPNWLELMLELAERENVGAVSAKLYYPDMSIQHIGGMMSFDDEGDMISGHLFHHIPADVYEKVTFLSHIRDVTWVTGACMMMRKSAYEQVGGMDEEYRLYHGDVDLCMKLRELGMQSMIHPLVELIHFESKSQDQDTTRQYEAEKHYFINKWKDALNEISQETSNILDNSLQYLGAESYAKTKSINVLTQIRETLETQIIGIYASATWKIGYRIARIYRFFVRK